MLSSLFLLLAGFALIVFAADVLTDGAIHIAHLHKIPPVVIGLTIVALGTSAPEIVVSIVAAYNEKSALAIGNVIGSNIANIGLVLGLTALITPPELDLKHLNREYLILFVVMLVTYILIADSFLGLIDGLILLLGLATLLTYLFFKARYQSQPLENFKLKPHPWVRIALGLTLLPLSADMIISSSVDVARYFGISELVIGLTIVALGTSLPEVVTSIVASLKGQFQLALGNIIGSNLFNILAVLPFVAIIHPDVVPEKVISRDLPTMVFFTILLVALSVLSRKRALSRYKGALLLAIYTSYLAFLVMTAR